MSERAPAESGLKLENKLAPKVLPLPGLSIRASAEKPAPGSAEEIFRRGLGRLDANDCIGAIEDFNAVIELDPKHCDAYADRARAEYRLGDYPAAIRDNTTALELSPSSTVFFNRALARRYHGDNGGALTDFLRAPEETFRIAKQSLEDKRYRQAVEYLSYVIEAQPRRRDAVEMRARAKHTQGLYKEAIPDYTRALELGIDAVSYYNRGNCRLKQVDYAGAIKDYDEAIKLRSTDKDFYWQRGLAKEALRDARGAVDDFTHSLGGPSAEQKRKIGAEIAKDRKLAIALAPSAILVWLAFWALLVPWVFHKPRDSWWGWLNFLGFGGVAYVHGLALNHYSKSKGRGEFADSTEWHVFVGLFGPVVFLPIEFSIWRKGKICRFCKTAAHRSSTACRRCEAPL